MNKLDELIAAYNTLFESATPIGEVAYAYDAYTWNAIRGAFADIIAEVASE